MEFFSAKRTETYIEGADDFITAYVRGAGNNIVICTCEDIKHTLKIINVCKLLLRIEMIFSNSNTYPTTGIDYLMYLYRDI
jgi:hypothetical protein